ncbi:hypothetical protein MUK42_14449 [Musa troglodytarum]|uniref:Uncharacterized protein n=1 Tax=Musa troglodytarum TaxID=320322 RepID=A0A9E7GZX4_9LILI|nr:hypothetical protein MUK42_14449 [Musa troglodytarum]
MKQNSPPSPPVADYKIKLRLRPPIRNDLRTTEVKWSRDLPVRLPHTRRVSRTHARVTKEEKETGLGTPPAALTARSKGSKGRQKIYNGLKSFKFLFLIPTRGDLNDNK